MYHGTKIESIKTIEQAMIAHQHAHIVIPFQVQQKYIIFLNAKN